MFPRLSVCCHGMVMDKKYTASVVKIFYGLYITLNNS